MDWRALLASTARLLDIHDCGHTPGTTPSAPDEQRAGLGTGMWLDVALQLLLFLHARDIESNGGWVRLDDGFLQEQMERHGLSEDDVLFVAKFLSTPTRLISLKEDGEGQVTTKQDTALIEWPPNTRARDRCRITLAGTRAIQLSQAAEEWLYTANDAEKLFKAVQYGSFADIPVLGEQVILKIRSFSMEITELLERRNETEHWRAFSERREDYMAVITEIQAAVEKAGDLYDTKGIRERFNEWFEREAPDDFSPQAIPRTFQDILQAIERLSRHFQHLLSEMASQQREVVGLVRFDQAAIGLAFEPCSLELLKACVTALGPSKVDVFLPSANDFTGILRKEEEEHANTTRVFDDTAAEPPVPAPIDRFLEAYSDIIWTALRDGPLSLGDAVAKGWMELADIDALPQLVGVYTAPDWLDGGENHLAVSVDAGQLDVTLPDGSRLEGDDLVLHWWGKSLGKGEE